MIRFMFNNVFDILGLVVFIWILYLMLFPDEPKDDEEGKEYDNDRD